MIFLTAILIVAIAVVFLVSRRSTSSLLDRRSDHIEVIAQGGNDSVLDVQLVAQLQQNGADITKPREILHYLYFPSEDLARNTVEQLSKSGYEASEKLSKHSTADAAKPWVVIGRRETVVNEKTIADMRMHLTEIAHRYHGDYDGWEAAVTP
jgi:regulator of RNase E activity RraB